MTDLLSHQLRFIIVCASIAFLILIGAYAFDQPAAQATIIAVGAGGAVLLWVLGLVLQKLRKRTWFPRIAALIGVVILAWLVALSGGPASSLWPGFLLVTVGTATALGRRESLVCYALTAIALTFAHAYPPYAWKAYDLALLLIKLGVILIPAEMYRHLYKIKEQHQLDLVQTSQREQTATKNLSRRNIELNLLNSVALTLNSTLELDHVLVRVIELTNASLGIELGSVFLRDMESGDLVLRTLVGKEAMNVDGLHIPRGKGIAGWVCEHGETALIEDVPNDPRFYNRVDELSGFATRSMLAIPLQSKDRVIGVIEAMNKSHGRFNQEDQQLLEGLAAIAAPAIENALLHTQLVHVNRVLVQRYNQLREAQDQLVAAEKKAAAVELAGAAAHQLNQPLTVILCSLGMIRREFPTGHEGLDDIDVIEQAVAQATQIVNKIGSITEYKTKTYVEGIQILDLEEPKNRETELASSNK